MTSVFIGGSRAVSRLDSVIRGKLNDLIERNCIICVGDANGADKAVQQYLAGRMYTNVIVYRMDTVRNNVGNWPTKRVASPGAAKDFAYYAAKDMAMAEDAKCGVMLWDGKSKGTLNNIQNLIGSGKKTLVYLSTEKAFHKLCSHDDLAALLDRCDNAEIAAAQRQIKAKLSSQGRLSLQATRP